MKLIFRNPLRRDFIKSLATLNVPFEGIFNYPKIHEYPTVSYHYPVIIAPTAPSFEGDKAKYIKYRSLITLSYVSKFIYK